MGNKTLYICKSCYSFFSGLVKDTNGGCPHCTGDLMAVDVAYEQYSVMSEPEKKAFHEKCVRDFFGGTPAPVQLNKPQPEKEQPRQEKPKQEKAKPATTWNPAFESHIFSTTNEQIEKQNSGWISGTKFVMWLVFIVFILGGLISFLALSAAGSSLIGLLCLVLFFCIGFLSVSLTMVFLDMAQDIKVIRSRMGRK